MKTTLILQPVQYIDDDDDTRQKLLCNGKTIFESRDLAQDCPEDATLARDMTSCFEIAEFLEKGFKLSNGYDFVKTEDTIECESYEEFEEMGD